MGQRSRERAERRLMGWRDQTLGGYTRQLTDSEVPAGVRMMLGPDHISAFCRNPMSYPITLVSTGGGGGFAIDGDYEFRFKWPSESIPCQFYVEGSTGNDNGGELYTVADAVYNSGSGKTIITVTGSVPSAVADGEIVLYRALVLPVYFNHPLLPTVGVMPGARGETLSWERPAMLKPELELKVEDWDTAVRDQLCEWLGARQRLRFWLACEFAAVGYIAGLPIDRPLEKELVLSVVLTGMRRYKANAEDSPATVLHYSYTDAQPRSCNVLETPFVVGVSDITEWSRRTILHGQEIFG